MAQVLEFLLRHGYGIVFAVVFLEQLGLPLPAAPLLLAMGALAAAGKFSFLTALLGTAIAAILGDTLWFELGKRRGESVLTLLCRISLEPDSCVRTTKRVFGKTGAYTVLIAKFVPGLSTAAPPLAGMMGWSTGKFFAADFAGSLLWGGAFLGAGFLFHTQLEHVAAAAAHLGSWAGVLLGGAVALFLFWKYIQRRRFLRRIRVARITAEEVARKLDSGEEILVLDLRGSAGKVRLPGAVWMHPSEIEQRHHEIPRDRDIILYCS
jgi:membrane protein DedA with SNARE-associated domain